MKRELKQELISFYIVFLKQIGMPKWVIHKAMGLTPLQAHIITERAKVTRKVWLDIMFRDNWTCYLCGHYKCYPMELEHVHPLFHWGYSTYDNMKAACKHCNRAKGIKILEDRVMYPAIKQMNAIIVILLFVLLVLSFLFWQSVGYLFR
jgi:hypothetical protein